VPSDGIVAILIAVIGTPATSADALPRFRAAWLLGMFATLGSAAISSHRQPEAGPVTPIVDLLEADAA